MKQENEYIKIDLMKIMEGMIKRLWTIILSMVIGGSVLFSYAAFLATPLYQASTLLYVNNSSFSVGASSFSITSSEISAAKSLVDTYLVILKARLTLNEVIERGQLDITYEELYEMITAEAVNETEVFSVIVTSDNPYEAEKIANMIAQVLPDKIASVVEGSSVSVVDYAVIPSERVSPQIRTYALIGLLGGLLLSCGIIAVIEILDDQISSESYLLENFEQIPLLTVVPDLLDKKESKGHNYYYYQRPKEKKNVSKTPQRRVKK